MQFAAVGSMPTSSQHREEERLRQASERQEKDRQQARFLQRTFGLPQEEVLLRVVLPAHFHRAPATRPSTHLLWAPTEHTCGLALTL